MQHSETNEGEETLVINDLAASLFSIGQPQLCPHETLGHSLWGAVTEAGAWFQPPSSLELQRPMQHQDRVTVTAADRSGGRSIRAN